ncbi:hypothetical protein [Salipiger sp. PrR003]|uniref:hypothetical protein n=1 Tax=Salipiger sp. PrR003 TaxID=2706776 RepID=UPI0013DBBD59|nr:hypothetical protein [Salipiger sp. PrR003]NDV52890.1 hypothetical protein [Salipiger sp. PrR003]
MSNWIIGSDMNSGVKGICKNVPELRHYLVHLEHPRCIVAIGDIGLGAVLAPQLDVNPYFYKNRTQDFELVLLEGIDEDITDLKEIQTLFYDAATHYCIHTQDALAMQMAKDC